MKHSCSDVSVVLQVRFVESEFMALRAFVKDLALLVQFLREEAAPASATDGKLKSQISGWLRSITGLRFISALLTQLGIDDALKEFSKKAQSDKSIIIFYPEIRGNLKARLELLQKQLGPNAEARLPELQHSKYKYEKAARARAAESDSSDDDGDDMVDSAVARNQEVAINLQVGRTAWRVEAELTALPHRHFRVRSGVPSRPRKSTHALLPEGRRGCPDCRVRKTPPAARHDQPSRACVAFR